MNAQSSISRSCLLLVFLLSIGCNSAYRELLKTAQQAAESGDFLTAARFYRKVCDAYPTEELACGRAPIFAQKAAAQAVERARPLCEAGELDRCLRPLLEAQQLVPDHIEITALIERASQLHAKRCAAWSPEDSLNTALAGLACLQARAHQFPFPHYQSLISKTADRLALRFVEHAGAADDQAMSGASAVLWSAAQCLSPGPDHFWPAQQARKHFLDSSNTPVLTYLGGAIPPRIAHQLSNLCPHLSPKLPAWAQCMQGEKGAYRREVFHLQIDAVIQDLQEKVDPHSFTVDVVTDIKQVKNPAYDRAAQQLQSAEAALQQAEQQRQQAEQTPSAECSNHKALSLVKCKGCPLPEKSPCIEMAAENYRRKAEEHKQAKEKLLNTSTTVEKKIIEPFKYTVTDFTWTSDFHFTIYTNTPGTVTPLRLNGVLTFKDRQRFRSELANIQEDPFEPPTNETFAKAFLDQLTPQVVAAVQRDGEQRGFTRRAQCKELPADWSSSWVQCWAEASLWESGKEIPADTFLQLLASSAGSAQQVKCR
jgi:hypothetical protein